jgi:hypothetical protein
MLFKRGKIFVLGGSTMMMQKAISAWGLIGVLVLLPMVCPSDAKEVYR